jgi:penicillin-binding protein 2
MGGGGRLGSNADASAIGRVPLLAFMIAVCFAIFFGRLFQLQLVLSDDLRMRSESNYVRTVRLEAPRGDILDRDGRILATTRPAFGVEVIPNELRNRERTLAALSQLIDEDHEVVSERVGEPRGRRRFQAVRLASDLSFDQRARVDSHLFALQGVVSDWRPRRDYVGGELGAHFLGYIGEVQRRQLETRAFADYQQGEVIGQSGLESELQSRLRGRAGGTNLMIDVAGRVIGDPLDKIEPVAGSSVTLTIDLDLQRAAERAYMPDVLGGIAKMGAAVALDVRTGDVLAMVSKPSFDPNDFAGGISAKIWKELTTDEWRPIQNRAISGQYPPGSTYKAIVAAAGLQEGLAPPSRTEYCSGAFQLGRRAYRCWKKGGHGTVDLHRALVESCDVYFYKLGLDLGIDRIAFFARGMGLGRKTGIKLPQEQIGLVPTARWKERRFGEPWLRGETVSASIGQGFNLMTPIQLAVSFASIANGGKIVRPRLLLYSIDAGGTLTQGPPPEIMGTVPVDAEHLATVRKALTGVVHEPGGTGRRSRVEGIRGSGKSGTAQVVALKHTEGVEDDEVKMRHRDHAWFVGYAPADEPEIVVAALVEHGGSGGANAGPVVQKVLQAYFDKQRAEREADMLEAHTPLETAQLSGAQELDIAGY